MAKEDEMYIAFGYIIYSLSLVLSVAGNSLVLFVCYRSIKRQGCLLKWFIANLAVADLTFALLSILDAIADHWTWVGGKITCKLQSFFIEACYTLSITTLSLISFERLKAVVEPFRRIAITTESVYRKLIISWIVSLLVASPLLYAYQTQANDEGTILCTNDTLGDLGRQIYYSIHAIGFFLGPLIFMIYAQAKIFSTLRFSAKVSPRKNTFTAMRSRQHLKVAKPLAALTLAFAACWSPFFFVRALRYFHVTNDEYMWRATQFLIFLNTLLDPIIYGIYRERENVKAVFKLLFSCANI